MDNADLDCVCEISKSRSAAAALQRDLPSVIATRNTEITENRIPSPHRDRLVATVPETPVTLLAA
jgi:hypothetical protein